MNSYTPPARENRNLTEVEAVRVAHLVADHAAEFYGQCGPFSFGFDDAVRYNVEGYVGKVITTVAWNVLYEAVAGELAAHPEILSAGRLTPAELAARKGARQDAAQVYDDLAGEAFKAGDYPLAAAYLDAAERQCPEGPVAGGRTWDALRALVAGSHTAMLHDEQAGRDAYAAGDPRAPGANGHIQARLVGNGVGDPRNAQCMEAFLRGYDAAADEAAAAAIA